MVSEICTHPHIVGNQQRIYRECCQMRELGWEVDFLYWGGKLESNKEEMRNFFGKEHFHYVNKSGIASASQLKAMVRSSWNKSGLSRYFTLYYGKDELYDEEVDKKIQKLLKKEKYDAIWLQYAVHSKSLQNIEQRIFKIIDTHDVFACRNKIYQKQGRVPEGVYVTRKQEREALSRADLIVAIQNEEERYFEKQLKKLPVQCITLGDMVEVYKSECINEKTIGFIGAKNDVNVLGIEWLVREVLPFVYKMEPECKCIIAGDICGVISDNDYYTKIGRVKTLQEYYDQICLAINPTQNGTGLNIKGIEALSFGKPLISTEAGAKGLSGAENAMVICRDAKEFAEQIVLLLKDRQKRLQMRKNAENFIGKYNKKNHEVLLEIENMAFEHAKEV